MPTVRRVRPTDLLSLNLCNLDSYTENYDLNFYLTYLMTWPSLFQCVEEEESGKIVAYIMGKLESSPPVHGTSTSTRSPLPWHGHITILTVSPPYRRLGYAKLLTTSLEQRCNESAAWFVDLYVRASNRLAIEMYQKMGYSVYRRVVQYYSDDPNGMAEEEEDGEGGGGGGGGGREDAFDMRKPLDRDKERKHVRENGEDYRVSAEEVY